MGEAGLLTFTRLIGSKLLLLLVLLAGSALSATGQQRGNPEGEWRYWGADQWST
jgi:hypothetical protein